MDQSKVLLLAFFAICLLSSVMSRPHGSTNRELTNIAADLTQTLREAIELLQAERSPRRRRRMVQLYVARAHHHPKLYHRSRRGRRPWRRGAGRNADLSDH